MAAQERRDYTNTEIDQRELCRMTAEELEDFYSTNAAHGLSPRDAGQRLKRRTGGKLFVSAEKSTTSCIADMFSQPILWILLALALVAVLFERPIEGAVVAAVAVAQGILLGILERKAQTVDSDFCELDAPKPRVLRGGKLYRVRESELTVGDMIVLFEGDIVPADVRLLSSADLEVEEYITSERVLLIKDSAPIEEEIPVSQLNSPSNIVYAGDLVKRGYGVAVVTAVGLNTHVGARNGGIRPLHGSDQVSHDAAAVRTLKSFFSVYSLAAAITVIPLVIISILTLGAKADLFDIILTAISLAAATIGARCIVLARVNHTVCRTGLSGRGEAGTSSLVKSRTSIDMLGRITDIVAIGSAAIHDGIPHPEQILTETEPYVFSDGDNGADLTRLAERLHLLVEHSRDFDTQLSFGELRVLSRLTSAWGEPELDDLSLRLESVIQVDGGIHIAYKSGEEQTLKLTDNMSRIRDILTESQADFIGNARKSGRNTVFILANDEVAGIISYARHTSKRTAGAIRFLEDKGVRVFAFDYSDSYETRRTLGECGFNSNAPIYRASKVEECVLALNSEDKIFNSVNDFALGGVRAFVGVRREEIEDFIRSLKKEGRRVAVVAHELDDLGLMDMGDVSVSCYPDCDIHRAKASTRRPVAAGTSPDSHPNGARACDIMLRRADILINRANAGGGGFVSIARAYASALRCEKKLAGIMKYLVSSVAARSLFVAIPMIFGLSLSSGGLVLFSGMIFDALSLLGISLSGSATSDDKNGSVLREHNAFWIITANRNTLISTAIAFASYFLVSLIAWIIGFGQLGKILGASAFAMLLLQFTVYLTTVKWREDKSGRLAVSRATAFLTIAMLMSALGVAVCLMISSVSPIFLLLSVIVPVGYVVGGKVLKRRSK